MSFDQRAWMAARHLAGKAYIHERKAAVGCIDCGEKDPILLDFDHKPGTEKYRNVGCMTAASRMRIDAEIEKCEVRCHTCHTIRHGVMASASFPRWKGGRPGAARDPKTGRLVANA